jgi:hypothetical protein
MSDGNPAVRPVMTPPPVSVTQPVSPAIERVKQLLFRPFDLGRWFVIGFCAWLAYLGEGGGFNFPGQSGYHKHAAEFRGAFDQARTYVLDNLAWIIPVAVVALVFALILGVVLVWLRSRGEFMFLHCVAHNRAEIARPWKEFSREGNSLFLFRLALGAAAMVVMWPLVIFCGLKLYRMWADNDWDVAGILSCVGFGFALLGAAIVFAIVGKLTSDFVVPLMFLRRQRCLESWRAFGRVLATRPGQFLLYFLFQIVLAIAIGILVVAAVLVTCCIAGCLLVLPYLGTVLLLPVLVFRRSYSLCYLAQYGGEYDVFAPPSAPPPLVPAPVSTGVVHSDGGSI